LDRFFQGDINDPELQTELRTLVLTRNQEALAILSEAMKKPNLQFVPILIAYKTPQGLDQSAVMAVNKVARLSWQNTKDDKRGFAWEDALANIQFAKKYGSAENASLLNFLVALACVSADSDIMTKNIANLEDREIAIKTATLLNDGALTLADFKATLKEEYQIMDDTVRGFEKVPKTTLRSRYIFKPNDTRQRALDRMTTISKAIDRGDYSLGIPPPPRLTEANLVEKLAYMLRPNSVGRALLDLTNSNLNQPYQDILKKLAHFRVQSCAFALRAYWLDHNRLPDTLDELTPTYIKTVPLDIYGGQPMQYDHDRAVVYSVGPKLIHSTGEFAREPNAHPTGERPFVLLDW